MKLTFVVTFDPWPHRASASVSALSLASMLENEYDADAWYEWYSYQSMRALQTSTLTLGVVRPLKPCLVF